MASNACLIVSITRKHKYHTDIVAQLQAQDFAVNELVLPQENSGVCSLEKELGDLVTGINLVIVYVSADAEINVCVAAVAREAEARGIRLVSIWLDDVTVTSVPTPIDNFSDAITPYFDTLTDVFSGADNPWLLPDGSEPSKRKIKKHTCG
ncbi:hypothetical protein [Paraburkholderia sediminicola]|uniref:hypothetical protein n=1 Tax=Paraburkholderia sediminicola TaxID=458836 RepID=UPI0038B99E8A